MEHVDRGDGASSSWWAHNSAASTDLHPWGPGGHVWDNAGNTGGQAGSWDGGEVCAGEDSRTRGREQGGTATVNVARTFDGAGRGRPTG